MEQSTASEGLDEQLALPKRYELMARLGAGGGGEVWAVRERVSGTMAALKVLSQEATPEEMEALVREAIALSGLEGLGLPRVLGFGRLPSSGRPYLIRELVQGRSIEECLQAGEPLDALLSGLVRACEQLTVLHRAGFLHGDLKPANMILEPSGRAILVDLGLAARWRGPGVAVVGLTPRYAAPELLSGGSLTVRAEVYSLGATLRQMLEREQELRGNSVVSEAEFRDLMQVALKASERVAASRFPSADEFANAIRRARGASVETPGWGETLWPIVGIDAFSEKLKQEASALLPGQVLCLMGESGTGRSVLLRRLGWSLALREHNVISIDAKLGLVDDIGSANFVLIDDADALPRSAIAPLARALAGGARLVMVGGGELFEGAVRLPWNGIDAESATELVRRAVPALTERHLAQLVERGKGRPRELRALVDKIARHPVASAEDMTALLSSMPSQLPSLPLEKARLHLERGHFGEAERSLAGASAANDEQRLTLGILKGRAAVGLGEVEQALRALEDVRPLAMGAMSEGLTSEWQVAMGRALIGNGDSQRALEILEPLTTSNPELAAEGLVYLSLALMQLGQSDRALALLDEATAKARSAGSRRIEAIALGSLALAAQRREELARAEELYEQAILAAESAGDAGNLASLSLNLAGLCKIQGNLAQALQRYESALDMGRRSGRTATVRQALLNLANLDLYLGRTSRAETGIVALEKQQESLPAVMQAQLIGLRAELLQKRGATGAATEAYFSCASAYRALARKVDAAEAELEGVLVQAGLSPENPGMLLEHLERARAELSDQSAHRPLLHLAEARVLALNHDELGARRAVDRALELARQAGQREWTWRALELRASLEAEGGQWMKARRDLEEALSVLEEIAARLPRDLREVFWDDSRRRELRSKVQSAVGAAPTEHRFPQTFMGDARALGVTTLSRISATPLEQRLARILEVNHELAGVWDLERLTTKIIDSAVALLSAEGGAVLLEEPSGALGLYASRVVSGDNQKLGFSRSIAERVMALKEPIVSLSAHEDARMKSYVSVHQMLLQSVACVPICGKEGRAIGALYLETRLRPAVGFEAELPTLLAFADQIAIALENARLVNENQRRATELEQANHELEKAKERLTEVLEARTVRLKETRAKLKGVQETLYSHFGYGGLVGTSQAMRRVYGLIDRVKDAEVPVLITGESGTGKEVVARAIHQASLRAKGKFLGVNCGALPENLLESELFGHVRGAFTGADRDRKGLFHEASGGSLLLDEIGEMSPRMQTTLLRVLQERKVRPLGGTTEEAVDVRVLFATHRDLGEMVSKGTFREDLYYRIDVVTLHLPSLRERAEDIPQLVDHFLGLFSTRYNREKKVLSRAALRLLSEFPWPGNVRQLEHVLLNAWIMSEGEELFPEDFQLESTHGAADRRVTPPLLPKAPTPSDASDRPRARNAARSTASDRERERILQALAKSNWNRVRAAEIMGMPRRTFYRRLRDYGIQ